MFSWFAGLTAIDVSLCGPADAVSQSVLALAVSCAAVVQIAVPVLTAGPVPNTAPATGAGASTTLCVKSTGCGSSPAAWASAGLKASIDIDTATTSTPRTALITPSYLPPGRTFGAPPQNPARSDRICHSNARTASHVLITDSASSVHRAAPAHGITPVVPDHRHNGRAASGSRAGRSPPQRRAAVNTSQMPCSPVR